MQAQILLPKTEPYMVGHLHRELPRLEKALRQKAKSYLLGPNICVELKLVEKWEILCGLELLTSLDQVFLCSHPGTPPLYQSGVVYRLELPGLEEWLTTPVLYGRGYGDCEDLACTLAAERRVKGIHCNPFVSKKRHVWHVQTICGEVIEDPSRVLGMGKHGR